MSEIGVYFESWASKWISDEKMNDMDMANLDKPISVVYIAFASPKCYYKKDSFDFSGSGLSFSQSFKCVKNAVEKLKAKGIKVMIAVGGGAYWSEPSLFNAVPCVDLCNDLGCDGIDIDWEVGVRDEQALVDVITRTKPLLGKKKLSFCGFSTGAYAKNPNDPFSGMNVMGLQKAGHLVDWVNIMCYDAGKDFDAIRAFKAYRNIYTGPLNLGFEIGKQGWGDAILKKEEVIKSCEAVVADGKKNGIFIWAYFSQEGNSGSISRADCVKTASLVFGPAPPISAPAPPVKKPTYSCPSSVLVICPHCSGTIKTAWSKE